MHARPRRIARAAYPRYGFLRLRYIECRRWPRSHRPSRVIRRRTRSFADGARPPFDDDRPMVPVARRNLFAEKGRFAMSVGGVAFAVLLILIVVSLYRGWSATGSIYTKLPGEVWIAQAGTSDPFHSTSLLPAGRAAELRRVPGVVAVSRSIRGTSPSRRRGGAAARRLCDGYQLAERPGARRGAQSVLPRAGPHRGRSRARGRGRRAAGEPACACSVAPSSSTAL